jgi:hypothetical protein
VDVFHHEDLRTMWSKLRTAALFYIRHYEEPRNATSEQVKADFLVASKEAANCLQEYAVLAEVHFGHLLCKSNLHKLVCQLPVQQRVCGHAAWYMEYWVEMMVQFCKRFTKFLTTSTPELLLVNQLLLKSALINASSFHEGLQTFDELVPAWGGDKEVVRGSLLDVLGADGEGFLGSGVLVQLTSCVDEVAGVLDKFYQDFPDGTTKLSPDTNEQLRFTPADMVRYTSAHRGGVETVHSVLYKRTRLRESCYVQVRYEEQVPGGGYEEVLYVGKVQYFLGALSTGYNEAEWPAETPRDVGISLRLAVSDLYRATVMATPMGDLLEVRTFDHPTHKLYPVQLDKIDFKVARCSSLHHETRAGARMCFIPYKHTKFDRS